MKEGGSKFKVCLGQVGRPCLKIENKRRVQLSGTVLLVYPSHVGTHTHTPVQFERQTVVP